MAKYRIRPSTPARDVLIELQAFVKPETCNQANIDAINFHIASGHKTAMDLAINTPNQHTALIDLYLLGRDTDPVLRKVLIGKIIDPMMAFGLYVGQDYWTDEEDGILREIFAGKLPTAEKELENGKVTRAKK